MQVFSKYIALPAKKRQMATFLTRLFEILIYIIFCFIIWLTHPLRLLTMRTLAGFSFFNNGLREFIMKTTKTYMDKLMENKEFREKFDKEYQSLCIEEKIAEIRYQAKLTQDVPVNRRKNNKPF